MTFRTNVQSSSLWWTLCLVAVVSLSGCTEDGQSVLGPDLGQEGDLATDVEEDEGLWPWEDPRDRDSAVDPVADPTEDDSPEVDGAPDSENDPDVSDGVDVVDDVEVADTGDGGADDAADASDAGETGDAAVGDADAGSDVADAADAVSDLPDAPEVDMSVPLPDLTVRIPQNDVWLDRRVFNPNSCPVREGCIPDMGPGDLPQERRLLRFTVITSNIGDANLELGTPSSNPQFVFDACHNHYHFHDYASYELHDLDGNKLAFGHKQAFCLLDSLRESPDAPLFPRYNCNFQGIQAGWADAYTSGLDCQWIDVTEVPNGEYIIHVDINDAQLLPESDFSNNHASLRVTIGAADLSQECLGIEPDGTRRNCGWTLAEDSTCTPGVRQRVGCNGAGGCELGDCLGDPMLRVCQGSETSCFRSVALASSDDACGEACPYVEFDCPAGGEYTVWAAPRVDGDEMTCTLVETTELLPEPTLPCVGDGDAVDGLGRNCGWDMTLENRPCFAGFDYVVGCNPAYCSVAFECPAGPASCRMPSTFCSGEPMLRVCEGDASCSRGISLGESAGACGDECPEVRLSCPESGVMSAMTAPIVEGETYECDLHMTRVIDLSGL